MTSQRQVILPARSHRRSEKRQIHTLSVEVLSGSPAEQEMVESLRFVGYTMNIIFAVFIRRDAPIIDQFVLCVDVVKGRQAAEQRQI
jgi:hypothetical protein